MNKKKAFDGVGPTCARCGSCRMYVTDSRMKSLAKRRRRKCADCGYKDTTYEISQAMYDAILQHVGGLKAAARDARQTAAALTRLSAALDFSDETRETAE